MNKNDITIKVISSQKYNTKKQPNESQNLREGEQPSCNSYEINMLQTTMVLTCPAYREALALRKSTGRRGQKRPKIATSITAPGAVVGNGSDKTNLHGEMRHVVKGSSSPPTRARVVCFSHFRSFLLQFVVVTAVQKPPLETSSFDDILLREVHVRDGLLYLIGVGHFPRSFSNQPPLCMQILPPQRKRRGRKSIPQRTTTVVFQDLHTHGTPNIIT